MSNAMEHVMPCGCKSAVVKRMAPAIDKSIVNEDGEPLGAPKMENGAFVMEEVEEIEETYCAEHTNVLIERQHAAQKMIAEGRTEEALQLMQGASPFLLTDGGNE